MKRIRTPHISPSLFRPTTSTTLLPRITLHRAASSSPVSTSPTILSLPPARNPLASAKLPALHSRLSLHPKFPLETLARTLVHPTAESDRRFNNDSLSTLGQTLINYYTSEYLMVHYPRLPTKVMYAAAGAYIGDRALSQLGHEWGVEAVFEPTADVDSGLLQFRISDADVSDSKDGTTQEKAMAQFVASVFAGVYMHEGASAAKQLFRQHVLSRKLDIDKLFDFRQPTRELSRLCSREGFEPPVARLLAETGRRSRNAVFVVGVYSGSERLGEGHGGSMDEARIRAAVNALKGWYLYRPFDADLPSKTEMDPDAKFRSAMIDVGEVIV